jgi:hypothetical protein
VTFTATVTATVAQDPTGTVTLFEGGTALQSVAVTAGPSGGQAQATFAISFLSAGGYSLTAQYSGDSTFAGSASSPLAQVVTSPAPLSWSGSEGSTVFLSAALPGALGSLSYSLSNAPQGLGIDPNTGVVAVHGVCFAGV